MANKNKNTLSRLTLFVTGVFLSPISWIIPKKKNRIIFNSTTNSNYSFNSKYLFEYFVKQHPEFEIKFVINDEILKEKLTLEIGNYFITNKSLKNIFYCLRAFSWITSSLETPIGGIFLRINRLVIHLGHGTPLKNIGFLEKNMSFSKKLYYHLIKNNFTYVLSTSHNFDLIMSNFLKIPLKRIFTSGQPRNDSIFQNKKNYLKEKFDLKENEINILYVPTWRQSSKTILFPFKNFNLKELESFLKENNVNIFLRLHPIFEKEMDENLLKIQGIYNFDSSLAGDVTEYLSCFDMLITDYSSVFIDYLLLNRPILFFPYDLEEYEKTIGFTVDYNLHTPGSKVFTFDNFRNEIIKYLRDKKYYEKERINENVFYNCCRDKTNCEKISKFIMRNIGELK